MNPTRILPDLQAALLCEDVRREVNGNFLILGVIGLIRVPQVPVVAMKLCVFTRWTAGVGNFTENVRLLGPDQNTVIRQGQTKFVLKDPVHHATNLTVFGQVQLPSTGLFFVEVMVDEVMKLRFPVPVMVVQAPAGQPQPPAPAPAPTAAAEPSPEAPKSEATPEPPSA